MHNWGDEGVDWAGIGDAAWEIESFCRKWGRFGGQSKEKYGTVRFYAHMGARTPFCITHPGHVSYLGRIPKWLMHLDIYYGDQFMRYTGLRAFFNWWQPKVYNWAYQRALAKHPHLRAEILVDADYPELIKGVTRREKNKLHILGWEGEILATWEGPEEDESVS